MLQLFLVLVPNNLAEEGASAGIIALGAVGFLVCKRLVPHRVLLTDAQTGVGRAR